MNSTMPITVKIAGPAGSGIKSSGLLLSRILSEHGFFAHDYSEYPSLVRGGHNTYQVTFSSVPIHSVYYKVDLFFSLQPNHWQTHTGEFSEKSLVLVEGESQETHSFNLLNLPLSQFTKELGSPIYANSICLGAAVYLLNLDKALSLSIIASHFGSESPNLAAFNMGYDYAVNNFSGFLLKLKLPHKHFDQKIIVDGNEAYGWGFVKGGGNFYAAYPMTPATGALHFLASKQKEYNLNIIHPEDEIAAASMVAGAAFAGARAATGTSGGGFALMNETISFCGVAEIGAVFYLVSRPGPATGLPTWTSQGDLLHAIYSGHGEFPKVVLAPSNHDESYRFSAQSLNIAKKYQLPVLVLSDKLLAESSAVCTDYSQQEVTVDRGELAHLPAPDFKRYSLNTATGVSPYSLPGTPGGEHLSNSYEHDESGYSTEDAQAVDLMMQKRARKLKSVLTDLPPAEFIGSDSSKTLIVSWGSTKGAILEALSLLPQKEKFALLHLKTLWPINPDLHYLIKPFKKIIVIENDFNAQIIPLLKSQFDFHPSKTITKGNGRPFFPEELKKLIVEK